jgi:hypothetical protein
VDRSSSWERLESPFEDVIRRGLYEGLMKGKMQVVEQAGSEGDTRTQMVKLMEIEALAEESGTANRARIRGCEHLL